MPIPLLLLLTYLIGAIPTGVILTRLAGTEDIRKVGSGNIGATNVYRVGGRKLGILTLAGDALKGVIPLAYALSAGYTTEIVAAVALVAFLGHCYPVYLRFKGGKGVATALGILLVVSPWTVLGALGVFTLVLWKWRYISLASISAAATAPLFLVALGQPMATLLAVIVIAGMVIFRHRPNIERLLNGTESRFRV
jgi:acyl phosphate:glycerol-3-phosphate acyltransferase